MICMKALMQDSQIWLGVGGRLMVLSFVGVEGACVYQIKSKNSSVIGVEGVRYMLD